MSMANGGISSSRGGVGGASRLLTKLQDATDNKRYYEAHQLVKTISFRFIAAKKFAELEGLLYNTSFVLLDNGQFESGADVAIMLSKLYLQAVETLTPSDQRMTRILNLLSKMPPSLPERVRFITEITEWSENESNISGPFHLAVAQIYINEQSYSDAWRHLIRSNNGVEAASLTRKIIIESFIRRDELDLVIGMLVVGFLALGKIKEAEDAYRTLVNVDDVPELSPLLNGVRYLVESAKLNDPDAFVQIRDVYEPSFSREHHLRKLVLSAGKTLFNLSDRPATAKTNPMSMIMNAFLSQDQSSLD